ncbi:hypothetical protein [Spongiactinospora sp. 9N601]|uniref:hypothetical protein n=1 Tax=Spongiactinospora sp. 9N601 TaxID=3375149 RepID=UPI0037B9CA63
MSDVARFGVMLGMVAGLSLGCSASVQTGVAAPRADTRPVLDSAPYICEFVPASAVRLISGYSGPLTSRMSGEWKTFGHCRTPDIYPDPVSIGWAQEDGDKVWERLHGGEFAKYRPTPLPPDLGRGSVLVVADPPGSMDPYDVFSIFRCGGVTPWIDISLARVAEGRDAVRDLTELMRIAQRRYGELHGCVPRPG